MSPTTFRTRGDIDEEKPFCYLKINLHILCGHNAMYYNVRLEAITMKNSDVICARGRVSISLVPGFRRHQFWCMTHKSNVWSITGELAYRVVTLTTADASIS